MTRPLRIAILHPELGIGGAERLIVSVALGLQSRGHRPTIFTARRDPAHCFAAARDGSLDVRVHGSGMPLHVGGRLRLPAAIARMARLATAMLRERDGFDLVFCDMVAHVIPLLRRRRGLRTIFYCHFPDLLQTPPRRGWYRWYRVPFDRWEARALDSADRVLVNSAYTAGVYRATFPRARHAPEVLHPAIDVDAHASPHGARPSTCETIVAVSRFDPGKNLGLALEAYAELRVRLSDERFARTRLVIAGGYDARLRESRDMVDALGARAAALGLTQQVELRRSPGDAERLALLSAARCVVYTPVREHFGYVPIEAMAAGRPVLAVHHAGPTETVVDDTTGWLLPPTPTAFGAALQRLFLDDDLADRFGEAGRARAQRDFSLPAFAERLDALCRSLIR
jgi:alpha-1,3/alpha-1,6-mannosyltransferase